MAKSLRDHNNDGQRDAANGKYKPPHGLGDSLTFWGSDTAKRHQEENAAYRAGHKNAKKGGKD